MKKVENSKEHTARGRIRKWVVPRYRRYLLFYVFENDTVHLIDVVDGKTDYDVEDSP